MVKKILTVLVALVVLFIFIVMLQPNEYRVTRTATITATPNAIYAQVNNLQNWDAWSPWAKLDPNAKHGFEGPKTGKGSAMTWSGNNEVGEGRMTVLENTSNKSVKFQLDFERPMKGTSYAEFTFTPVAKQTVVSWTMYGKKNFMAKAVGLIMNCDKMIGDQFEQGLGNLKGIVEKKKA